MNKTIFAIGFSVVVILSGCNAAVEEVIPTSTPTSTVTAPFDASNPEIVSAAYAGRAKQICAAVGTIDESGEFDSDKDWYWNGSTSSVDGDGYEIVVEVEDFTYRGSDGRDYNIQTGEVTNDLVKQFLVSECPEQVKRLDKMVADAKVEEAKSKAEQDKIEKLWADGLRISDNQTYLVGKDMKPGTWHTLETGLIEDCYWERTSSSGNIIDNHFGNSRRMTVTVRSGEIFKTQNCGAWDRV